MGKAKFHLTIKDNETGEVLHDVDTCVILGAFDLDEKEAACVGFTACDTMTLVGAIAGMDAIKRTILDDNPRLKIAYDLKDTMDRLKQAFENEPGEDHGDEEERGEN